MSASVKIERKRRKKPPIVGALGAIVAMVFASCGEKKGVEASSGPPPVSVVVAPVIQKTVPIFTEMTARTDATDSVDIRARVKAFS